MTPGQQWDETCGSARVIDQHGLVGGDTLFAWPNNKVVSSPLVNFVEPCFGTSRTYGAGITSATRVNAAPYEQSTRSLNGGNCSDPSAPCYKFNAPRTYVSPAAVISQINALRPGQWYTLQQYLFVTDVNPVYGASKDRWDCTAANPADHWTNDAERYCWTDVKTIYRDIASRIAAGKLVLADPGGVEAAFGRTGYSDLAVPRPKS